MPIHIPQQWRACRLLTKGGWSRSRCSAGQSRLTPASSLLRPFMTKDGLDARGFRGTSSLVEPGDSTQGSDSRTLTCWSLLDVRPSTPTKLPRPVGRWDDVSGGVLPPVVAEQYKRHLTFAIDTHISISITHASTHNVPRHLPLPAR